MNVPVDATEKNLRLFFANRLGGGRIEDVEFEETTSGTAKGIKALVVRSNGKKGKKRKRGAAEAVAEEGQEVGMLPDTWDRIVHRSGATAVVRFVDATSAQLVLREARKIAKTGRPIPWISDAVTEDAPLGAARYRAHHELRYPDHEALQESTDAYMAAFAAREAESARQLALKRMEPDEDGFITVVRGGRNGPARPQRQEDGDEDDGTAAKKKKKQHKGDVEEGFYRFQVRERKKREHGELAKKFEEDARRVEEMRRRRGKVRPE